MIRLKPDQFDTNIKMVELLLCQYENGNDEFPGLFYDLTKAEMEEMFKLILALMEPCLMWGMEVAENRGCTFPELLATWLSFVKETNDEIEASGV